MLTAQAVSFAVLDHPAGQRHAQLIFAVATDGDGAEAVAIARVEAEGWTAVTPMRRKELAPDPDLIENAMLRSAARYALRDGCSFVVYADPLPPDA